MPSAAFPNRFALLSSIIASVPFFQLGYEIAVPRGIKLIEVSIGRPHADLAEFEWEYGTLILLAVLVAGLFINYFGRRWPFGFGLLIYAVGAAVLSFGSTFETFKVGRGFMIVGTGFGVVIGPIYIAEVSPARVRGFLGSFPQLLFCFGRLSGYAAQLAFREHHLHNRGWQVMTGIPCVVSLVSLATLIFSGFRESPAYLPIAGLLEEARTVMEDDMGCPSEEADERIDQLKKVANIPPYINGNTNNYNRNKGGIDGMWSRFFNGATVLLILLHILHQLTGEFIVSTYTRSILISLGGQHSEQSYIRAVAALTGTRIVGSMVLMLTVDRFGRRRMMLASTVVSMLAAVTMGVVWIANQHGCMSDQVAFRWLAWAAIVFEAGLSVGLGGIIWMYGPETIGLPARAMAVAGAVLTGQEVGKMINMKSLSIYGQSLPRFGRSMLISAGFLLVCTLLTFAFIKDTSRETLTDYFDPSTNDQAQ
ncbi:unnamed protein product [Linum trigynum]|uniref:Major facilitator superfamily (MFS) profile domain-containing protein n=1 Tax=Linum trigynum TaxID=586398 RepID=A0AAV2DAB2_9ROSI